MKKILFLFCCFACFAFQPLNGDGFHTGHYSYRFAENTALFTYAYADAVIREISAYYETGNVFYVKPNSPGSCIIESTGWGFNVVNNSNSSINYYSFSAYGTWWFDTEHLYASWSRYVYEDPDAPVITVSLPGAWTTTTPNTCTVSAVDAKVGLDKTTWAYKIPGITDTIPGNANGFITASISGVSDFILNDDGTCTFRLLKEGAYQVCFKVNDLLGNSGTSALKNIGIDTVKPLITGISDITWTNAALTVPQCWTGLSASDALSGVNSFVYKIDEQAAWEPVTASRLLFTEGSHTLFFSASDNAGNTTTVSAVIKIDTTAPVLSGLSDISWTIGDVYIPGCWPSLFAVDALSGVNYIEYRLNETQVWLPLTVNSVVIQEGSTTVYIRATDNAGNTSTSSAIINIDKTVPLITGLNDCAWSNSDVTVVECWPSLSAVDYLSGVKEFLYRISETGQWLAVTSESLVSQEGSTAVYFKAIDNAGNTSLLSALINIDKSLPMISGLTQASWTNLDINLPGYWPALTAEDGISGIKSFVYRLGSQQEWLPITTNSVVSQQGEHTVFFMTTDNAGNTALSSGVLYIDKTAPQLSGALLTVSVLQDDNRIIINEGSYISADFVDVELTNVTDNLSSITYLWELSSSASAPLNYSHTAEDNFSVSIGDAGACVYLYVKAKDAAGNISPDYLYRVIRIDREQIGQPVIYCLTHPYAYNSSLVSGTKQASFRFSYGASGPGGIAGLSYHLTKGFYGQITAPGDYLLEGFITANSLDLPPLDDNKPGEFYFLSVYCKSASGRLSQPAVFVFRIDSTPPQNLVVVSTTHLNDDTSYSNSIANLTWKAPLDMTGIYSYYYTYNGTGGVEDTTSWIPLKPGKSGEENLIIDLSQVCANGGIPALSGIVNFSLCAEDFSGNRQFYGKQLIFDLEKPQIPIFNITIQPVEKSVTIDWITSDNNKIHSVALWIGEEDETPLNWIYLYETVSSWTFSGLDTGKKQKVIFKVLDSSVPSNETSVVKIINWDENSIEEPQSIPINENILGYTVHGIFYPGSVEQSVVYIDVPGSLILRNKNNTERIEVLEFDETVFTDGEFQQGTKSALAFTLEADDLVFDGTGIGFSRQKGLFIFHSNFNAPDTGTIFNFIDLQFGPPPGCFISNNISQPLSSPAVYQHTDPGTAVKTGFQISGISNIALEQRQWIINSGFIDFLKEANIDAYILENNVKNNLLPVYDVQTSSDSGIICGTIGDTANPEFFIDINYGLDNLVRFKVLEGGFDKNKLVIEDAILIFTGTLQPLDSMGNAIAVHLYNFNIDFQGSIQKRPGFSFTPFTLPAGGTWVYQINSLDTGAGAGGITASGLVSYNNAGYEFYSLGLNINGHNDNAFLSGILDIDYSGFTVTCQKPFFSSGKISLPGASIDLDVFSPGLKAVLSGLSINPINKSILVPGICELDFYFTPAKYGNNGINPSLHVTQIRLDSDNLYAVYAKLDAPLLSGEQLFDVNNLILNNNGTTGSASLSSSPVALEISGFSCTGYNPVFNGESIAYSRLNVNLPAGCDSSSIDILNYNVNFLRAPLGSSADQSVIFSYKWDFKLSDFIFNSNGLSTSARCLLPETLGSDEIVFPDFILQSDNSFITGISGEQPGCGVTVTLKTWDFIFSGISINSISGYLQAANYKLSLYPIMGGDEFKGTNLVINNQGVVINSGTINKTAVFLSANGYLVQASSFVFGDETLMLAGLILLPQSLGENIPIAFNDPVIRLSADGKVTAPPVKSEIIFQYAGFDAKGYGITFNEKSLLIDTTLFQLNSNTMIPISNLQFYPDGAVYSSGQPAGIPISCDLFSWQFSLVKFKLTDKGIDTAAYVSLPESMGGAVLYFDSIIFYKESGQLKVLTDISIPVFDFTFLDTAFHFEYIRFNASGLLISSTCITLPSALDNAQVNLVNLQIGSDGSLYIGCLGADPFLYNGYEFNIYDITFKNNSFGVKGYVIMAPDFPLAGLSGSRADIKQFNYNFDTGNLDFEVELDRASFEIDGGWRIEALKAGISNDLVTIGTASLYFPEHWQGNFVVQSIGISGFSLDLNTGIMNITQIAANNISVTCDGYSFTITSIAYSPVDGFLFAGNFPLTGLFEEDDTPPVLVVQRLQITNDFTIGDIVAGINGINAKLTPDIGFNGNIGIANTESGFMVSLSGNIQFLESFSIDELKGKNVGISSFIFDVLNGTIKELKADASFSRIDLLGLDIMDFVISVDYTQQADDWFFTAGGNIAIPADFPAIGNERLIVALTISPLTGIKNIEAGLMLAEDRPFFTGMILKKDSLISVIPIKNSSGIVSGLKFNMENCVMEFTTGFPVSSLAGTQVMINALTFTTDGNVEECDFGLNMPQEFPLLDGITLFDGSLRFTQTTGYNGLTIDIKGELQLPESFESIRINIKQFTILPDSTIIVAAETAPINKVLKDHIQITNGIISFNSGTGGEFLFGLSGTAGFINTSLPDDLKDIAFTVKLLYSTHSGMKEYSIALSNSVSFDIYAGIKGAIQTLAVSNNGLMAQAALIFPESFYGMSQGLTVTGTIDIGWDGVIRSLEAGIGKAHLDLYGFALDIDALVLDQSGISLHEAVLTLPDVLDKQKIKLVNARIDTQGQFYGDFIVDQIIFPIAGCKLVMESPRFDSITNDIRFTSVKFVLPDALGNKQSSLNDVSIGASGIQVGGGFFQIPDFEAAGGTKFYDLYAEFAINKLTQEYTIGGMGSAFLPGLGGLSVKIAFTNITTEYPIGLKYAAFSFNTAGLGIPIGATGLYLNGISGALAFGPPGLEMPADLRDKFGSGMRISLSVFIRDNSGSIQAEPGFWINLNNWDFAVFGNFTVLSGFVKGYLYGMITQKYGFEAKLKVSVEFNNVAGIYGMARIHIWNENGTKLCGEASVTFLIKKGAFQVMGLPWSDWGIGPLGIQFGDFKNGVKGFKGYIDNVFILGTVGFFASSSGVSFDNISQYVLLDSSTSSLSKRVLASPVIEKLDSSSIKILKNHSPVETKKYNFSVPVKSLFSPIKPIVPTGSRFRALDDNPGTTSNVERIIFDIRLEKGDPLIKAVSPSGRIYTADDPDVLVLRGAEGIGMAVLNPEPGDWNLEVSNLPVDVSYTVKLWGINNTPSIMVNTPVQAKEIVDSIINISGKTQCYTGNSAKVTVYLSREKDTFAGEPVGETLVDNKGLFNIPVDCTGRTDGEYFVYAGVDDGINPERLAFAPGSFVILPRQQTLLPVTGLIAGIKDLMMEVSFDDPNSGQSAGYNLYVKEKTSGVTETFRLGSLKKCLIPGLDSSSVYILTVKAYDVNNKEGDESEPVEFTFNSHQEIYKPFQFIDNINPITVTLLSPSDFDITFTTTSGGLSGLPGDYMDMRIIQCPEWLFLDLKQKRWKLDNMDNHVKGTILNMESIKIENDGLVEEKIPAIGSYTIVIRFENMGNRNYYNDVTIPVVIRYPEPVVQSVYPASWNINEPQVITARGMNFIPGTSIWLDDQKLEITDFSTASVSANVPLLSEPGDHIIKVIGPDNQQSSFKVSTVKPDYNLFVYNNNTVILPGQTASLYWKYESLNDYNNPVTLTAQNLPYGFSLAGDAVLVHEKELGCFKINSALDISPGDYRIVLSTKEGKNFTFNITINSQPVLPHIESLSSTFGSSGEILSIFGYGFGEMGTICLDEIILTVYSWSPDHIKVILPQGKYKGFLYIKLETGSSNSIPLEVVSQDFALYPGIKALTMQPGDKTSFNLVITGNAPYVDIFFQQPADKLLVSLDKNRVDLNGSVLLQIESQPDTIIGIYNLIIYAASPSGNIKSLTIPITIGEVYTFDTNALPQAVMSDTYSASLATRYGVQPQSFETIAGALPPGVLLSAKGLIEGIPVKDGEYTFTVKATDSAHHSVVKEFTIRVDDEGWYQADYTPGSNRYTSSLAPGASNILYNSRIYNQGEKILLGSDRLFVVGPSTIDAVDASCGQQVYTLKGDFSKAIFFKGFLITLDKLGILSVLEPRFGSIVTQQSRITNFFTDNENLFVVRENFISKVKPDDLIDIESYSNSLDTILFVKDNFLYRLNDNLIEYLEETGWTSVTRLPVDAVGSVVKIVTDKSTIALILSSNKILLYYQSQWQSITVPDVFTPGLIMTPERLIVSGDTITIFDRQTLNLLVTINEQSQSMCMASDKLLIANKNGIFCYNVYNGKVIWQKSGNFINLIAARDMVYALSLQNDLYCFYGEPDITQPICALVTEPAGPDGDQGYYITRPQVSLTSEDKEGYVKALYYEINQNGFNLYTSPFELEDGIFTISYYAVDSNNLKSAITSSTIFVDSTPPVTALDITGEKRTNDYYLTGVIIRIYASDPQTGVRTIFYSMNDQDWQLYTEPVTFNADGSHTIRWYALNNAGKSSTIESFSFKINMMIPEPLINTQLRPGIGYILLDSSMNSSLDYIEYTINGAKICTYTTPVALEPGFYRISCRTVNLAGNKSSWKTGFVRVRELEIDDLIKDVEIISGKKNERAEFEAVYRPHRGIPIFSSCYSKDNKINWIPDQLEDSFFLRTGFHENSFKKPVTVTFTAKADIDVYLLKHRESVINTAGWELVRSSVSIEPIHFYKGGADLYKKCFKKGEFVSIPPVINKKGYCLIFVKASPSYYNFDPDIPIKPLYYSFVDCFDQDKRGYRKEDR